MKQLSTLLLALALIGSAHAETYQLDQDHTQVGFKIKHMGISTVSGHFEDFEATVSYDGKPESLELTATIQANSINTKNKKRDNHLRSDDFFDVKTYPTLSFTSTGVEGRGDNRVLKGQITIKDVTRPIALDLEINGPIESPWQDGSKIIGVVLTGELNRQDFGVSNSGASDKVIGNTVKVEINLEAKR